MSLLLLFKSSGSPPPITCSAEFGQGSGTSDAIASLNFTSTATLGQGSGTSDAVASLNFASTGTFGQGSGTFDALAALGFSSTAEFGQGAGTFDAIIVAPPPAPPSDTVEPLGGGPYVPLRKDRRRELEKERIRKLSTALLLLLDDF